MNKFPSSSRKPHTAHTCASAATVHGFQTAAITKRKPSRVASPKRFLCERCSENWTANRGRICGECSF